MITVNIDKAKTIAHDIRRASRAVDFAPLDAAISTQLPGADFVAIEAQRQAVRDKYATMQVQIDAASSIDQLKAVLP